MSIESFLADYLLQTKEMPLFADGEVPEGFKYSRFYRCADSGLVEIMNPLQIDREEILHISWSCQESYDRGPFAGRERSPRIATPNGHFYE